MAMPVVAGVFRAAQLSSMVVAKILAGVLHSIDNGCILRAPAVFFECGKVVYGVNDRNDITERDLF
jgi:hypothetical protein